MANYAPSPPPETRGLAPEGPAIRPRETVGDLLRRARLEHGVEIEALAEGLRIRGAYLAAIEQGRYDRLPGPVYALGFVRAYANYLGLDGDEAVRRFKLEAAGLEQRSDLSFPMPLTQRSIPGGRMLLVAFVLAVVAYGLWHYLSTGDRNRPERVAAVPSELMPPPPPPPALPKAPAAPVAGTAPEAAPPPAATAAAPPLPAPAPVAATPLPPPAAAPSPPAPSVAGTDNLVAPPPPPLPGTEATAPPPPPVADSAPPAAAPEPAPAAAAPPAPPSEQVAITVAPPAAATATPTGRVFGTTDGPSHITVRAVKDCWIQVRDGTSVVSQRTLRAGDSYRVPDRDGLVMRVGNAVGLEVVVDGKTAPSLNGTVRNIALDPERLLAGTARTE
jgi:cytoskeleton protein RodZ